MYKNETIKIILLKYIFCNNIKLFNIIFDQFIASLLNKSVNFLLTPNIWVVIYAYYLLFLAEKCSIKAYVFYNDIVVFISCYKDAEGCVYTVMLPVMF